MKHMEKFEVKPFAELEQILLTEYCEDFFHFFRFQLTTNYGFVFQLNNGTVIFLP